MCSGFGDHSLDDGGELHQRQLVSESEGAVLRPQLRGHEEQPPVGIVELADVAQLRLRHDRSADAPRFLEAPPHRLRHRQRIAQRAAKGLRRLLQVRIMVAVLLDIVAHPIFGRDQRPRVAAIGEAGMPLRLFHRGVQPRDRVGDRGRIVRQLDELIARHSKVAEHRVREDFTEGIGTGASPAARGEGPDIDVVQLGELQQQSRGDWPLIALEVIEVARADPETLRHVRLRHFALAAEAAQAVSEEQFRRHEAQFVNLGAKRQVKL
jgi:hypothetical protein